MARACGVNCAKAFLLVFNFFFLALGGCLVAGGVLAQVNQHAVSYVEVTSSMQHGPALQIAKWSVIGVGSFIVVISFLGCCGACAESTGLLGFYSVLVFVVVAAQVTIAILGGLNHDDMHTYVESTMQEQIRFKYNRTIKRNKTDPLTDSWDVMQMKFKCCGGAGPKDYEFSKWFNETASDAGMFAPMTCCVLRNFDHRYPMAKDENQCQIDALIADKSDYVWTTGCAKVIRTFIENQSPVIIGVASGIVALELLALVSSCILLAAIRREHRTGEKEYHSY